VVFLKEVLRVEDDLLELFGKFVKDGLLSTHARGKHCVKHKTEDTKMKGSEILAAGNVVTLS
jgi:hypothetical protein